MNRNLYIAREGWVFVCAAGLVALVAVAFLPLALKILGLALFGFVVAFFRDPQRKIPTEEGAVVSPADGKVVLIVQERDDRYMMAEVKRVAVFMNLHNVHVNRAPVSGVVDEVRYNKGRFLSANLDKASMDNEQNAVILRLSDGRRLGCVQIAGLIARRIVCNVKKGDEVIRGMRIGMIRFGSRLEVLLPPETEITVKEGQKVRAGESVLGYLR